MTSEEYEKGLNYCGIYKDLKYKILMFNNK